MAKNLKEGDFLFYSYDILCKSWPGITKKLGLHEDAFPKPEVKLIKRTYSECDGDTIKLSYYDMLGSYAHEKVVRQGLEVKCEDIFKDDIIHESVHYLQDKFYNIGDSHYGYTTEGLACMVGIDLLMEEKAYNFIATEIAYYFAKTRKEYKDYFGLPKEYNKHIEDFIKKDYYKRSKKKSPYAKGFTFICETYGRCDNYLELLIDPFYDAEVD